MIKKSLLLIFFVILQSKTYAYDDSITHLDLSDNAVEYSSLDQYTKGKLNLKDGIGTKLFINSQPKTIKEWIKFGSTKEDKEPCRRSNHFHNPINENWQYAGMDELPSWACDEWHPLNIGQAYSALTWATGYITQPPLNPTPTTPDGLKAGFSSDADKQSQNWDKAREYYYKALTLTLSGERESHLAQTFQSIGQVLHLLQDMAVPAHVRNDFLNSHIYTGGANPYESYVKENGNIISALTSSSIISPNFTTARITDFWDTNQTPQVVTDASLQDKAGLSEYTNANFVSEGTLFTNSGVFSYPSTTSVQEETVNIADPFVSGWTVPRVYYKKTDHWDTGYLLAGKGYLDLYFGAATGQPDVKIPPLDDNVHKDYANHILPRAVGYSAALLDYFFRGTIDIILPTSGIYSSATSTVSGYTTIKVQAKNTTSSSEAMNDGSIRLVVKYRRALEDPFKNYAVDYDFQVEPEFTYIVAAEKNGTREISTTGIELTFDLPTPIPVWAIDIYLQVVYQGKLGNEDSAVAVGFKDISEPTPIDISSDTDRICMSGSLYSAGSTTAIDLVDKAPSGNNNGIADEWDVYQHSQKDIYVKISTQADPKKASSTDYTFTVPVLAAGNFSRTFYILTDDNFSYSIVETWKNDDEKDPWVLVPSEARLFTGTSIKNQTDYVEDEALCYPDSAPCYIWWYPEFLSYRERDEWWGAGVMYTNKAYPEGSECTCYSGILNTCM